MATDDYELDSPEIIALKGESALVDNDIETELYVAANDKRHYPDVIALERSGLIGNDVNIRVSYGMPLPPKPAPVEPAQIPTTEPEKATIRRELEELAQQIEELLRDDYPLSPHEASERSGLGEEWPAVLNWRRSLEDGLRAKYVTEILPRVIDTYERARVRGFFDPEIEEQPHTSRVLMVIEKLPGLLRKAAARS